MARIDGRLVLFVHPATKVYLDYGSELERVRGLMWSSDGVSGQAYGFEEGDFEALLASKRSIADVPGSAVELRVGEPIVRRVDMNPRGDI